MTCEIDERTDDNQGKTDDKLPRIKLLISNLIRGETLFAGSADSTDRFESGMLKSPCYGKNICLYSFFFAANSLVLSLTICTNWILSASGRGG